MPNADVDKRDILLSTSRNGEILANVGEVVNGVGVGSDVAVWGVAGFISMPDTPSEGGAAQALCLVDGMTKRIIATRDSRLCEKVGEMLPGDCAMVGGGAARILCKKATDTIAIYTETSDGTSMMLSLDGSAGQAMLAVGKSYIQMTDGEIVISVGANLIKLDQDTILAFGKVFQAAAGAVMLGNFAIVPLPINAAIKGTTGAGGTPSSSVFIAD